MATGVNERLALGEGKTPFATLTASFLHRVVHPDISTERNTLTFLLGVNTEKSLTDCHVESRRIGKTSHLLKKD